MENILELKGLVMPSNYVSIDDEEMEYVDGSWSWKVFGITLAAVVVAATVVTFAAPAIVGIGAALAQGTGIAFAAQWGALMGVTALSSNALGIVGGAVGSAVAAGIIG